jgi:hypothetical protein
VGAVWARRREVGRTAKKRKGAGKREVGQREVGPRELLEKGRGKSGLGVLFFFKYFFKLSKV